MMKLKKGFTLTEVLVALAVVGVIAALVIPQFISSVQRNSAGATLGKAIAQIELGCQNMLQAYNNRNEAGASMVNLLSIMRDVGEEGEQGEVVRIIPYSFSGANLAPYIGATLVGNNTYRFTKFPATITIPNPELNGDILVREIIIDVNGASSPNQPGRDQFYFDLRNTGKLIPYGLNDTTCNDGDENFTVDENCTARVVRDGFKINY